MCAMDCRGCEYTVTKFLIKLSTLEAIRDFLIAHGVIRNTVKCDTCGDEVTLQITPCQLLQFRCSSEVCNFTKSARKGTFVGNSRLTLDQIVTFCALWCLLPNPRHNTLKAEVEIPNSAAINWSVYCREVCLHWVYQNRRQIGGPGTIVEMDEGELACRKRGGMVKGQWVFGGVQRGDSSKFFVVPVEECEAKTVIKLVKDWILPGTIVISDCWKVYDTLQDEGFLNLRVSHSVEFMSAGQSGKIHEENIQRLADKHPDLSINTIRKWLSPKYSIPVFGHRKENFEGYFAEHIFKANFSREHRIHEFFRQAAEMCPPPS